MTKSAVLIVVFFLLTSCTLKPGNGSTIGNDVITPLWEENNYSADQIDATRCTNVVALLIGIGQYDPAKGWEPIQAQNDVTVMTETLRKQGVPASNIHQLIDQQATRMGITQALQKLTDTLRNGTLLIILYGGHARQLQDDNNDEADGYDEAIVPFDAPSVTESNLDGYLRDDVLNQYFTKIRAKLGATGMLWLLFDSCHSQTLNRNPTTRQRGGVVPLGSTKRLTNRPTKNQTATSGWHEAPVRQANLAPYVLFAATTDGAPSFETTTAQGRSLGPLTRAVGEAWRNVNPKDTYRTFFNRVAVAMTQFAPYQQPTLEGDTDRHFRNCNPQPVTPSHFYTRGETLRISWPPTDTYLTKAFAVLPFVQPAANRPDLRIEHRGRGYALFLAINNQLLTKKPIAADECIEHIRQYFARNVLMNLHQTSPDFQIHTSMKRLAVRSENGQTVVTDTLPSSPTSSVPTFRISADERMELTLTNTGPKPFYVTMIDLLSDGRMHVLLPEIDHVESEYRIKPGESLRRRIRLTAPTGAEVYKLLLTPTPIDLRSVLQIRGSNQPNHPYERIFQRIYATRGQSQLSSANLSSETGATADVAFWVTYK